MVAETRRSAKRGAWRRIKATTSRTAHARNGLNWALHEQGKENIQRDRMSGGIGTGGTGRGGDSDKHGNGKSEEYDEYCSANMLHHMSRHKSSEQYADCGEVHKMGSDEGLDESTFRRQPSGSSEKVLERRRPRGTRGWNIASCCSRRHTR